MDHSIYDKRRYPIVEVQQGYGEWVRTYEQDVQDEMDLRLLARVQTVDWSALRLVLDLLVRPMLFAMQGRRATSRPRIRATAVTPIVNRGSRRGYLRVTLEPADGRWKARLTGDQGSGILRSMVSADGFAVLAGDTTVAAGGDVEVMVLREVSR